MMSTQTSDGRQLDTLEWVAVVYLLMPVGIFFMGWVQWPLAGVMSVLLLGLTLITWQQRQRLHLYDGVLCWRLVGIGCLVALIWVSWIGLVGGFRLNMDWKTRMPILRDLSQLAWPIGYVEPNGTAWVLRFPLGYYLVPAGVNRLLGGSETLARVLLWLWTVTGVSLFFTLLLRCVGEFAGRSWRVVFVTLGVCIGFSGMDAVGQWLTLQGWPALGDHLEWWVGIHYQYSSITTQLFFVPNHALAGWLAALVVWRHQRVGLAWLPAGLLMLGVELWSPLVALGLAPFLVGVAWLGRPSWRAAMQRPEWMVCCVLMVAVGAYLTLGVSAHEGRGPVEEDPPSWASSTMEYLLFTLMEWALLAWVVGRKTTQGWIFWVIVAQLLLLPLFRFGPGNDLVMRGSIPALMLLMLRVIEFLWVQGASLPMHRAWVMAMLIAGWPTPFNEFYRNAVFHRADYASHGQNFVQICGTPWHYVVLFDPKNWIWRWVAPPVMLQTGGPVERQVSDPPNTRKISSP